jgi:Thermolysin metallopeptidase, alpha-helical domain/Thermolysin metallopeptidase, catalytic domain
MQAVNGGLKRDDTPSRAAGLDGTEGVTVMNTFLRRTCRAAIVLAVLAALICSGALTGSTAEARDPRPQPSADPQVEVLEKLRVEAGAPTNVTFRNGFPRIVHTSVAIEGSSPVERARRYLAKYKGLYGQFMDDPFAGGQVEENRLGIADPSDRLRDHLRKLETYQGKRTSTPDLGLAVRGTAGPGDRAVAFYQTYKGIEVFGGNVLVFVDGDKVVGTVGSLLSDVQLDVLPRLADSDAEVAARRALGVRGAPALARTELVVFDRSLLPQEGFTRSEPHLAWRVALADRGRHVAFVDASSGELLFSHSQVRDHSDDYDLDLEDANGEESNSTNCYWDTTADDALGDEDGLNASGQADPEAVALWKHAKDAYDFYHDAFGLHSYDDDDGQYELYVHANVPNARWVPGSVDCDLIEFANGWVAYDVLVHELGHGTLDFGFFGGPVYQGQPGALDESFADTMGALADGNYLIGEDLASGAIRSLSNPPAFNHPDRLSEFVMTSGDNGGVHTNSGIGNRQRSCSPRAARTRTPRGPSRASGGPRSPGSRTRPA